MVDLRIDFCGVSFENPFILAASPSTDNREMTTRGLERGWAGAVLKTTSLETEEVSITYPIMSGVRPGPGLVGLQNTDLLSERHIHEVAEDIAWLKSRFPEKRIIASLMGSTRAEWQELVLISEQAGADMIEASISCPQGAELEGEPTLGWMVSQDPHQTEKVTRWVVEGSRGTPVYVKLSPSVTDIVSIGKAVERGGGKRHLCHRLPGGDRRYRSADVLAAAERAREGHPRRFFWKGGQTDRAAHRRRPGRSGPDPDFRCRWYLRLAGRAGISAAWRNHCADLHGGIAAGIQPDRSPYRWFEPLAGGSSLRITSGGDRPGAAQIDRTRSPGAWRQGNFSH